MKYFKDFNAFVKRNTNKIDWDDYFSLGGRLYQIYEYGGGSLMKMNYNYVYFINKRTNDAIYVKYDCPSEKTKYNFIDAELIPNMGLWR